MRQARPRKASYAFTLAELLIALAILGVIATFTIPKVLQAQRDERSNANAKEMMAAVATAFELYKAQNTLNPAVSATSLTPYLNYVSVQTTGNIDSVPTYTSKSCSLTTPCLQMHNGGTLYAESVTFDDSNTTNFISFFFDPDAIYSGSTADSPGKSLQIVIYYNGLIRTAATIQPNSYNSSGLHGPIVGGDPSWFHWN